MSAVASLRQQARQALTVVRLQPFDTSTRDGRSLERYRRAVLTTLAAAVNRFGAVGVALLSVPLALHYLGAERYGLWLTITTATAWLGWLSLGLGPSLLNHLSAATGRDDPEQGRRLVATAWWLQTGIAAAVVGVVGALYVLLPWSGVFNASGPATEDLRTAATIVWLGMAVQMPLSLALYAYQAFQEGYVSSLWQLPIPALQLAGLALVVAVDAGMPALAVTFSAAPVLCMLGATLFLFAARRRDLLPRPPLVDREAARLLLGSGVAFTGVSLAALVILYSDNLVITRTLGPASVAPYATAYLLVRLLISVIQLILDAAWPAYGEAAARRDADWIRRAHARVTLTCVLLAAAAAAALLAVGRPLIHAWAGPAAQPSHALLLALALTAVVQAFAMPYSRLITALGAVRVTMWLGILNAAINLSASILLARWIGLPGVALGTVVGYLLVAWVQIPYAGRLLERVAGPPPAAYEPSTGGSPS